MEAPRVQYVKTGDGYNIAYTVAGAGTPIIFFPPGFMSVELLYSAGRVAADEGIDILTSNAWWIPAFLVVWVGSNAVPRSSCRCHNRQGGGYNR